jgi:hypothetical protein
VASLLWLPAKHPQNLESDKRPAKKVLLLRGMVIVELKRTCETKLDLGIESLDKFVPCKSTKKAVLGFGDETFLDV